MKKLLCLIFAAALVLSMAACSSSGANAGSAAAAGTSVTGAGTSAGASAPSAAQQSTAVAEKAVLSLAAVYAADTPIDLMCQKFAALLNDTGLFDMTYYGQSQYGSMTDVMEDVLADDNVIAIGGPSDLGDPIGITDLGAMMAPFQYDYPREIYAITESDWWSGVCAKCMDANVKIISGDMVSGARYFFTHEPVVKPADMASLKFRVPTNTNYMNIFTAFGTTPVSIAVADLYTSLQNGTVDAFEFPLADAYAYHLNEVSEYIANQSYVTAFDLMFMSATVWNGLSADQQAAIDDAIAEVCEYGFGVYEDKTEAAIGLLTDADMTFYDIDVDAYRACGGKYYELSKFSDGLKDILDSAMETYRAAH